jgi:hypothetical protein
MTTQRLASFSLFSILSTTLLLLLGCGGGGGGSGDNFIGAAEVRIQASPEQIDSGDRTEVQITLSNLHPNGIALKIRYPKGLDYVNASSFITINDSDTDVSPTINQTKGSDVYLVYYISADQIGENEEGTLYFELEGKDSIEDGEIEVDPDVDDPAIDNATEFNTEEPQFGAEDQVSIQVTD